MQVTYNMLTIVKGYRKMFHFLRIVSAFFVHGLFVSLPGAVIDGLTAGSFSAVIQLMSSPHVCQYQQIFSEPEADD